jgi:hypothetical protein
MSSDPRMDEYLWDPSRPPDPEVERLERLLARYRQQPRPLELPRARRSWAWRVAIPAALLVAASVLVIVFAGRGPAYRVEGVEGLSLARAGDWIEVGARTAEVEIGDIGAVELDPGSRVHVEAIELDGADARHELYLEEGALHARIAAGPRVFQVGTPAGLSIDLGCEYRLEVAADGTATIHVLTGQIAFGWKGHEVYVPKGASCISVPDVGPSPPVFDDCPEARKLLVARLARGGPWSEKDKEELFALESRDDALPLFAMLGDPALGASERAAIYDRLTGPFQLPAGVTREGVLALDRAQIDAWVQDARTYWYYAKGVTR